jgi:ribosome recycling factor
MQPNQIIDQVKQKLDASLERFSDELAKIRTGRANAGVLDKLMVNAYGTTMPIKQLANITAPEAQLIQVTPFDSANLQAIASSIREDQSLGLNPVDDGVIIRISVPPLTTERRSEIVKQLGDIAENAMISMRNARHEGLKDADASKKSKAITEDDYHTISKQIDDLMTEHKNKIEALSKTKEQEIMTV